MIEADRELFFQGLTSVAIAFGKKVDDPMFDAFWSGLDDIPIEHVAWALRESMKRCAFFPTVAALRSLADRAKQLDADEFELHSDRALPASTEEREALMGPTRSLYHCAACQDTGFVPHECSAHDPCGNRLCERYHFPGHHYVVRCACRETNPVFLKRMTRQKKYRQEV